MGKTLYVSRARNQGKKLCFRIDNWENKLICNGNEEELSVEKRIYGKDFASITPNIRNHAVKGTEDKWMIFPE